MVRVHFSVRMVCGPQYLARKYFLEKKKVTRYFDTIRPDPSSFSKSISAFLPKKLGKIFQNLDGIAIFSPTKTKTNSLLLSNDPPETECSVAIIRYLCHYEIFTSVTWNTFESDS